MSLIQSRSVAGTSLAFASNVAQGDLIIVVAGSLDVAGAITFACSDTQGNAYTSLALVDANAIGGGRGQLFYAFAKSSGANTVNIVTASATPQLAIHEFSSVSSFDQFASATGTGLSQDSGPATTTRPTELLFGYTIAVTVGGTGMQPGSGWTQAQAINFSLFTEYQNVSSIGAYDATSAVIVSKAGTVIWLTEIATFVAVSSGDYWLGGRQSSTRLILPGYAN